MDFGTDYFSSAETSRPGGLVSFIELPICKDGHLFKFTLKKKEQMGG